MLPVLSRGFNDKLEYLAAMIPMMCEFEPFVNAAYEQMLSASIPNEMNHRLGVHIQVLSIGTFNESLVLPLGMEELRQGLITCRFLIIQRV